MSDHTILAFDTSAAHCAAALLSGDKVLTRAEPMIRGQAERLIPMVEDLLTEGGIAYADLTRIGVGTGPGNFTGIRISVSAARGMALGLGIPAIGVSCLDALRQGSVGASAAIAGPRETAYLQIGDDAPRIVDRTNVPGDAIWLDDPVQLVSAIARLARHTVPGRPPTPMYLRAADAAPAKDAPPVILE